MLTTTVLTIMGVTNECCLHSAKAIRPQRHVSPVPHTARGTYTERKTNRQADRQTSHMHADWRIDKQTVRSYTCIQTDEQTSRPYTCMQTGEQTSRRSGLIHAYRQADRQAVHVNIQTDQQTSKQSFMHRRTNM